jgi:hypothetical protein
MYSLELAFGAIVFVGVLVLAACLIAVGIFELLDDDSRHTESGYEPQRLPCWEDLRLTYYEYRLDRLADKRERKLERLRSGRS